MGSTKPEKADKKEKKEKKRAEADGVTKAPKKDKKEKKEKKDKLRGAVNAALDDKLQADAAASSKEQKTVDVKVKIKKDDDSDEEGEQKPLALVGSLVPFAEPLADEKAAKKVLKSVRKAAKHKTLKRGVKEVVKALRKSPPSGPTNQAFPGVVIIAADISPMDVISHIPVLCEDVNVPYIFVTSRAELGAAGSTKRPTSVVMVTEKRQVGKKDADVDMEDAEEFAQVYKDLVKLVQKEAKQVKFT